jgi:NDP-sugar pyrophosphorylase family protein
MKAMLLAAGLGERLSPLTRLVPKPLLPVLGRPLAPLVLAGLAREGVREAVINLHHLPKALRGALGDGREFGLEALHYSLESERLLGTGGGIEHAARWLRGGGTILLRNSDFLADVPLARVVEAHRASGCPATLVVTRHRPGYTPVALDDRGRVASFGVGGETRAPDAARTYLFTGFHLIDESILARLPVGVPSDIVREVYIPLAAEGSLNAYVHDGYWWEFGTPAQYLHGSLGLVEMPTEARLKLGAFDPVRESGGAIAAIGAGTQLHAQGIVLSGRLVLGLGTRVGEGAVLEETVVMPEAWIGPRARLTRCIVGPGTEVPADFEADSSILAADAGPSDALPADTERMGGLLVRRFGGHRR